MTTVSLVALSLIGYAAGVAITAAGLFRDVQGVFPGIAKECRRSDLAFSLFCALFPTMWFIAPFITGFYKHGIWRQK